MLEIAVPGATGQMGRELIEIVTDAPELTVRAGSRSPTTGPVGGVDLQSRATLLGALRSGDVDVLIDFTVPEATKEHLGAARDGGVPSVIGTTGFETTDGLEAAAADIPVLKAANFAPGIHALRLLVRTAGDALAGYDAEIIEAHHNRKRDAPSGTAGVLLEELRAADVGTDAVYGREGAAERSPDEIGVHAVRGGSITGRHEVLFAGAGETVSLTHHVEDRGVFAEGAVTAARWLAEQPPGWYTYPAVLTDTEVSHGA